MSAPSGPTAEEMKAYSMNVWTYKKGEIVSLMIHLGDQLGLYRALDGAGPVTAAERAIAFGAPSTGLLERGTSGPVPAGARRVRIVYDGHAFPVTLDFTARGDARQRVRPGGVPRRRRRARAAALPGRGPAPRLEPSLLPSGDP